MEGAGFDLGGLSRDQGVAESCAEIRGRHFLVCFPECCEHVASDCIGFGGIHSIQFPEHLLNIYLRVRKYYAVCVVTP